MSQSFVSPRFTTGDIANLLASTNVPAGNLHGLWYNNARGDCVCRIWHAGPPFGLVVLENENFQSVGAQLSDGVLAVPSWSNIRGLYVEHYQTIFWSNGTYWTRGPGAPQLIG